MRAIFEAQRANGGHRRPETVYAVAAVCCCRKSTMDLTLKCQGQKSASLVRTGGPAGPDACITSASRV
jgi:hypothetical protein